MSRSRLGGPTQRATLTPTPPPHAPPLEVGMGPTSLAVGLIDYIIAIADVSPLRRLSATEPGSEPSMSFPARFQDPAQAKRLIQTDFMKRK